MNDVAYTMITTESRRGDYNGRIILPHEEAYFNIFSKKSHLTLMNQPIPLSDDMRIFCANLPITKNDVIVIEQK